MPDEPRTHAELLTDFAEGQVGGITSQKMRNYVESVADPVGGGSLSHPLYASFSYVSVFNDNTQTLYTLINNGSGYGEPQCLPFGSNIAAAASTVTTGIDYHDTSFSILGSDPDSTWGVDVAVGNAFMLPRGMYRYAMLTSQSAANETDINTSALPPYEVFLDQSMYDSGFSGAHDGTEPYMYSRWQNPVEFFTYGLETTSLSGGRFQRYWRQGGSFVQDLPDPQPFSVFGYTMPGTASDVDLAGYFLLLHKVM